MNKNLTYVLLIAICLVSVLNIYRQVTKNGDFESVDQVATVGDSQCSFGTITANGDSVDVSFSVYDRGLYTLYRDGTEIFSDNKMTISESHTDSPVPEGTHAYTLVGATSCGPASVTVLSISSDVVKPTAPTNALAKIEGGNNIRFTWDSSTDIGGSGVVGYHVYKDNILREDTTSLGTYDVSLPVGVSSCWAVEAYDRAGNISAKSSPSCVITVAPVVNRFLIIRKSGTSNGTVSINNGTITQCTTFPCPTTHTINKFIVITAEPEPNTKVSFTNCTPAASPINSCFLNLSANTAVNVDFSPIAIVPPNPTPSATKTLTINKTGTNNGSISMIVDRSNIPACSDFPCSRTLSTGASILIVTTLQSNTKVTFTNCEVLSYNSNYCATTLSDNKTVNVDFSPIPVTSSTRTFTITKSGTSVGNVSVQDSINKTDTLCTNFPCVNNLPLGSQVTITTYPIPLSTTVTSFSSNCASTSNSCSISLTDNTAVNVNFDKVPTSSLILTINKIGNGNGPISVTNSSDSTVFRCTTFPCITTQPRNALVTISAVPEAQGRVSFANCVQSSSGNSCSLALRGNTTIDVNSTSDKSCPSNDVRVGCPALPFSNAQDASINQVYYKGNNVSEPLSLASFAGKVTIIDLCDLSAGSCISCRLVLNDTKYANGDFSSLLQYLYSKYFSSGLDIVVVTGFTLDTVDSLRVDARSLQIPFHTAHAPSSSPIYARYGRYSVIKPVLQIPLTVIVDKKGIVRYIGSGNKQVSDIEPLVVSLLAESQ